MCQELCHQIFLNIAKFRLTPKTNDKLQFFLEFKFTHPVGTIFDEIRFGRIFLNIKRFLAQCEKNIFCYIDIWQALP